MHAMTCLTTFVGLLYVALSVLARDTSMGALKEKQDEDVKRRQFSAREPPSGAGVRNITFTNPTASHFYVDGTSIPEVDFDIGPSWSGLIPLSATPSEPRKLFFWLFPPGPEGSLDDLILWTNGGPGCSSLKGLLQENGPFTWGFGQARPTQNEWSWTNISSVLYVEQPAGTGFSQGEPNVADENDVAAQLVGFLLRFLEIFSELKGKRFFIAGESYAGMYVPYIANFIYEDMNSVQATLDLNLQGIWINNPVLGWDVVQSQIPAVDFVHKYENVFAFNQTFLTQLDSIATKCNYANYMSKYVTYPPKGLLPLPGTSTESDPGCDVWGMIHDAALLINPAFNQYRIFDTWPILWDVLGFPGSFFQAQTTPLYFNRPDVQTAIHAPTTDNWAVCTPGVFPHGDASLPPAFTVLPNVIEKINRTVIVHGLADFSIIAEGTRIVLQNMTWAGMQGFQNPIVDDSFVIDNGVALGIVQSERGLTYVEVALAGTMVPQFSPVASLQIMNYLVGIRKSP